MVLFGGFSEMTDNNVVFMASNPISLAKSWKYLRATKLAKGLGNLRAGIGGWSRGGKATGDVIKTSLTAGKPTVGAGIGDATVVKVLGTIEGKAKDAGKLSNADVIFEGGSEGVKVVSGGEGGGHVTVKLNKNIGVVRANGEFGGTGTLKLMKGDSFVKLSGNVGQATRGGGLFGVSRIPSITVTGRTVVKGVLITVGAGLAKGLWEISAVILPASVENALKSVTGDNCPEDCANEEDEAACLEGCHAQANKKAMLLGGFVLVGVFGLVMIVKGRKSSKEAENYYIMTEV